MNCRRQDEPHPSEDLLKPEHASLYPGIPANIWLGAAGVAARVAARLRGSRDFGKSPAERVLPDEHFEFRVVGVAGEHGQDQVHG